MTIENPAWEYIRQLPHDRLFSDLQGIHPSDGEFFMPTAFERIERDEGGTDYAGHRDRVSSRWTWAVPSPKTLNFIVEVLDGRPLVEIGAGSGYWAWQLSQLGVDVKAYDVAPIGHPNSWFNQERLLGRGQGQLGDVLEEFYPVESGDPQVLKVLEKTRVLFLCWPTMDDWAAEAVKEFKGDTVIYIGEGPGGCTADNEFFNLVGEGCGCWEDCAHGETEPLFEPANHGPMVQWSGLHDTITVYRRVR